MHILKQSTSVVIQLGPFVDVSDGAALEIAIAAATLDHVTTGIMISKNGGVFAVRNGTPTATAYDAHGHYRVTLNTTDTGTCGTLRVVFTDPATHLAVWYDAQIVAANVYDSLFAAAATDYLDVNTFQLGATPQTGRDVGASVLLSSGTGTGQVALTAGAVDTVTTLTNLPAITADWLTAAGTAPDFTTEIQAGLATAAAQITVNDILNETLTSHVTADSVAVALKDVLADTGTDGVVVAAASKTGYTLTNITGFGNQNGSIDTVTNITNAPTVGDLTTAMKASVLTEVNAALDTAISELSQGVPSATPSIRNGIMLMYMALRNQLDVQTSGTDAIEIHNDAGTQIAVKTITDDGSDYSEAKMTTGV